MDAYEGRQPCPTCGYKAIITYAFILLHHLQICSQSHIPKFRVCSSAFRTGRTTTWTQYTAYTVHKQEKTVALPNTMPTLFLANVIQQNQNRHLAVKFKLLQIMRPSTSVCNRGTKRWSTRQFSAPNASIQEFIATYVSTGQNCTQTKYVKPNWWIVAPLLRGWSILLHDK